MSLAVLAICLGACVGALARWQLGLWLNTGAAIPWGTLAANLIGGYLIGVCVALFEHLPELDPVVAMLMQSRYALALGTAAMHLLGSLALTVAGIWSFQAWIARA